MAFFLLSQAGRGWRQAQYMKMEAAEELQPVAGASLPEKKPML